MEGQAPKRGPSKRRVLASAGLVASGLVFGAILGLSHVAGAANNTATPVASSGASADRADPATVGHGPDETLLTGTTASKVKAAALDAVPGGTVIRVETDSEGSPYEAHVRKSDGSYVTVKVDKDFKVTSTVSGFGAGGPMHDQSTQSSNTSDGSV